MYSTVLAYSVVRQFFSSYMDDCIMEHKGIVNENIVTFHIITCLVAYTFTHSIILPALTKHTKAFPDKWHQPMEHSL